MIPLSNHSRSFAMKRLHVLRIRGEHTRISTSGKMSKSDTRCTLNAKEKRLLSVHWKSVAEHPEPTETTIRGTIPQWINGSLYRNGSGLFEIGQDSYKHLFDGMALLHRYHIKDGQVTYQSKFIRSDNYCENTAANRIACSEFGTVAHPDPCHSLFQRIASYFLPQRTSDNCAISLMYSGDQLFALTEGQYMRRVDVNTLDSTKDDKVDISKYLAVNMATAHPHYSNDGTNFNMGSSFGRVSKYHIFKVDPPREGLSEEKRWSILCSIPARGRDPSYYHSFGMTPNYMVFFEQPLHINVLKILTCRFRGQAATECMDYRPENGAHFHVFDRRTGEVLSTRYTAGAFICLHHINAYEDDGHLVVDMCCYDRADFFDKSHIEDMKNGSILDIEAEARRFVLPLNIDKDNKPENLVTLSYTSCRAELTADGSVFCSPERLIDEKFEMPQINYESYNGKPYQYVYGVFGHRPGMIKVDVKNKSFKVWEEEGFLSTEPIFIASPSATSEDDGVVISAVVNSDPDTPNFLVVLDARDFTEIGRAETNVPVNYGLHGRFVSNV